MRKTRIATMAALGLLTMAAGLARSDSKDPRVCRNVELLRFVQTIDRACSTTICDFKTLEEVEYVDDRTLFQALKQRDLRPVHLFFPQSRTRINQTFDWGTIKKREIEEMMGNIPNPQNAVIYVLGSASQTGSSDINMVLSQERMQSVMSYLKDDLKVNCKGMKGGYFGKSLMQMGADDARSLNIPSRDYREDDLILNQSVFVFVYPCGHKI